MAVTLIKRSIFNGKEYLDLIQQGKQMVPDKVVFITKHKEITSGEGSDLTGSVSIYGVPHHGERYADNQLVSAQSFNLPSTAGMYCSTVIDIDEKINNYEAIIIEINWGHKHNVDTTVYLQDVGSEIVKFRAIKPLISSADNNT